MAFLSTQNISLTMDEKAHIPSGYSYLAFQDYRLNPEHPPLAKDLAALPLLFLNLNFPVSHHCWTTDVNGQWDCGYQFLFNSGNNPDQIIFWARLPMMFLLLLLGWFIFFWARRLGGNKPALLALTLFSFSPTLLAHGRLVTTDIAAAFGFLIAIFFWLKFLKKPSAKNVFIAGVVLGIALCLKFSLALLFPLLAIVTLVWAFIGPKTLPSRTRHTLKYIGLSIIAGIVALVIIIWPIYYFHTVNYPIDRQTNDMKSILASNNFPFKDLFIKSAGNPILRPVSQYMLGLLMATQRVEGGNTVYFLGQVSGQAWKHYFPLMYLLKVPLAFHIFTLLTLFLWLLAIRKSKLFSSFKKFGKKLKDWLIQYPAEFSLLTLLAVYWTTSIFGNLNIGVRHILPVLPAMYILVSAAFFRLTERMKKRQKKAVYVFVAILVVWYAASSLMAFPYYLSYYNELVGGSKNGYKYAVDSNYDWGQDLKRLADFVEQKNIQKIKIAYFGGDSPEYRLGNKREELDVGKPNQKGWIAISATLLQQGRAKPAPGYNQDTTYLNWLNNYQPVARAGNSIFIYHIQ